MRNEDMLLSRLEASATENFTEDIPSALIDAYIFARRLHAVGWVLCPPARVYAQCFGRE
jgi:hypothetical protein